MIVRHIALVAAVLTGACTYDLDIIRPRDAGVDAPRVDVIAPPDNPPPPDRVAPPDVAPDLPVVDVPARMPMTGACTLTGVTVENAPAPTRGLTVITGTTVGGGPNAIAPPTACTANISPSSTRIYRYTMMSGTRLLATTNTTLCGANDTVLAAYFSCEGGGRLVSAMSCNDDDNTNLCGACGDAGAGVGGACGITNSTLDLTNLVPGDVIYLVVTSYSMPGMDMRGPFRLAIAENGLPPTAAPVGGPLSVANRCVCPPTTPPPSTGTVMFPSMGDTNQLTGSSRTLFSTRDLPFTRITGVSAQLTLSAFAINTMGACAVSGGAKAALDLTIGSTIVASAVLGISVGGPGTVTIPLTTFAPVIFTSGTRIPVQYQIRNVDPAMGNCVTLDVDLTASNSITLQGS